MTLSTTFNTARPVALLIRGSLPTDVLTQLYSLLGAAGAVVEDHSAPVLTSDMQLLLTALAAADRPLTSIELAQLTGVNRASTRVYLSRLVAAGRVTRKRRKKGNNHSVFAIATDAARPMC